MAKKTSIINVVVAGDSKGMRKSLSKATKSLGDVSPDLKKVEDYYLANINLELSKIELTPENKDMFDGYVQRLEDLKKEYNTLSIELTENGPNEQTINALIINDQRTLGGKSFFKYFSHLLIPMMASFYKSSHSYEK